jgi:GNAT superfamily N-acetyltransferase
MAVTDAVAVAAVVEAANADADRRAGRATRERSPAQRRDFQSAMVRFVERDPQGAWVAEADGERVVGMAQSIRRHGFWGLSMLFVDPAWQSRGVGRALLDHTLVSAEGASVRMIVSSSDPRALRRYWAAGLRLHPGAEAAGAFDRSTLPTDLPGRVGDGDDLDLVASVDAGLRGSRAEAGATRCAATTACSCSAPPTRTRPSSSSGASWPRCRPPRRCRGSPPPTRGRWTWP